MLAETGNDEEAGERDSDSDYELEDEDEEDTEEDAADKLQAAAEGFGNKLVRTLRVPLQSFVRALAPRLLSSAKSAVAAAKEVAGVGGKGSEEWTVQEEKAFNSALAKAFKQPSKRAPARKPRQPSTHGGGSEEQEQGHQQEEDDAGVGEKRKEATSGKTSAGSASNSQAGSSKRPRKRSKSN